jgi:putative ABC transport system permease protein
MFRSYLKIAIRNIRINRVFSLVNIAGLTVGLTCCILILFYINDEWSFDRFHLKKDKIYQLVCERTEQDGTAQKFGIAALVQGPAFKQDIPAIEAFTRVNTKDIIIRKAPTVFSDRATWVDHSFFGIFSFPLIHGNPATTLADLHSMVLTENVAVKYFGTTDAMGRTLSVEINGKFEPFIVTGIAKQPPDNSSIQFGILLSFDYFEKIYPDNGWMWVSFPTYFLLKPGANVSSIGQKMDRIYHTRAGDEIELNHLAGYRNDFKWNLKPLTGMHLDTEYTGTPGVSDPVYSYILSGVAIFILLIACINFINLTIAHSLKRNKEIGIRKVVGGKRSQLIIQFLSESQVICCISFLLAVVLSAVALPVFSRLAGKHLNPGAVLSWKLLSYFITLSLTTGLAAGFYPAFVLSGFSPVNAFAGKTGAGTKNYLARSLVVMQFTIATFLIIAMLFMYAQFNLLTTADLGYPDRDLLECTISGGIRNKAVMDMYQTQISGSRDVISAGYKNIGHFGGKTQAANKEFTATYEHIDERYLPTLGVKIVAGRNFSKSFPSDSSLSVLINQTFADKAGWTDPVGKTIDYMNLPAWGARKVSVIGLVRDYHNESLREKIQPMVFTEESALPLGQMIVRLRPDHIAASLLEMERMFHRLDPDHPFQYAFRDEINRSHYAPENKWKQIITFAAGIAICISCTGLFGLAMLSAQKRRKEIGVRKVLGGSVSGIAILLIRNFVGLVMIAFPIAIPLGAVVIPYWLRNFAYRVDLSWWRFGVAGLLTLLVAILAVSYQAIKAAVAKPSLSLRSQ